MTKIYFNISLTDDWPDEIILQKKGFSKIESYVYVNDKEQNNIVNRN